jgi:dTDP-4-amino-4,6-dideoxygalactose transaminase
VTIRLAQPVLGRAELERVEAVFATGFLTMGPEVARFEEALAGACDTTHAVAVSSGTAALHLAVLAAGLGPGDDVLVPAYTFPATANVVRLAGARPVFCDVDPRTGVAGADQLAAARTPATRAVLVVHLFGFPVEMDPVLRLAAEHGWRVLEDAAGALGSTDAGRPAGGIGFAGCLSFHPRKLVTTGEGGAVVTNDATVAATCRSLRHHGLSEGSVLRPGFNYRLSDIQATIGVPQVARLADIVARREALAAAYDELLSGVDGVEPPPRPARDGARHSWQAYVAQVDPDRRDAVLAALRARGIEAQIGTYDVATQPAYADRAGVFAGADRRARGDLALPFHDLLTSDEQRTVADELAAAIRAAG